MVQIDHVRTVRERFLRIVVNLQEEPVHTCADRCPHQILHIFPFPRRTGSRAAWNLDTVRPIEDDRIAEGAHDGKRTHIHDKIVVAKGGSALREQNLVRSAAM